ncbi:MAG: DNA mismatch repair endonuclease MutL, partial [Bacillota bacterium]|nr:DNA mismatch repair endonuclease MutL [Bacillota bacterium]
MGKIRLLAPEVVDKIAAGEVVERPASVVKELIENSLDAGARHIEVEVRGGGLELIRGTDDGEGIEREDLPLALARHATSKLQREEELWSVRTLGFRGEALASIAAVSRIELISRVQGAEEGWRIRAEGGMVGGVEPAGSPPGTTVVVRDLFFNTPVRRRFMQRPPVEAGRIASVVTAYALAQSGVSFRLLQEGRQLVVTPGSGRLLDAVAALQGLEVARDLVPVSWEAEGVAVSGYVGLPKLHRANRWQEWIFVNGRAIESPLLTHALEEAYRTLLPPRRFPVAILHCWLDPAAVDVNVHPAKREVRFYHAQAVHRAVYGAVTAALRRERSPGVAGEARKEEPPSAGWLGEPGATEAGEGGRSSEPSPAWSTSRGAGSPAPAPSFPAPSPLLARSLSLPAWAPGAGEVEAVPPLRLVGQVRRAFLVCEGREGLVLIDQHAAHERVLYDQLYQAWRREGRLAAQPLLIP